MGSDFPIHNNTIVMVEGIFLQKKEYNIIFDYMIYIDIPEKVRLERVHCKCKWVHFRMLLRINFGKLKIYP